MAPGKPYGKIPEAIPHGKCGAVTNVRNARTWRGACADACHSIWPDRRTEAAGEGEDWRETERAAASCKQEEG